MSVFENFKNTKSDRKLHETQVEKLFAQAKRDNPETTGKYHEFLVDLNYKSFLKHIEDKKEIKNLESFKIRAENFISWIWLKWNVSLNSIGGFKTTKERDEFESKMKDLMK